MGWISGAIWEKYRECKCNKDVRAISSAHIFQLALINDVNKRGVKVI